MRLLKNFTECKKPQELIEKSRKFHISLFNEFPALIWHNDMDGKIDYINKTFLEFIGQRIEQVLGYRWTEVIHPDDLERTLKIINQSKINRKPFELEYRVLRYDGEYRWLIDIGRPYYDLKGNYFGYIGLCYDITERKNAEEHILYNARHDYLTGLPNRKYIDEYLEEVIEDSRNKNSKFAVCFLDIDDFKKVNDYIGHTGGDELIKYFGQTLLKVSQGRAMVGRIGGDEFIIVLPCINCIEEIDEYVCKILEVFKQPVTISMHEFLITVSMGIAIYPTNGLDSETLKSYSDMAMYAAKDSGKNKYLYYETHMSEKMHKGLEIENMLLHALECNRFKIFYQPQIDLRTNEIVGLEALLRCVTTDGRIVPPDEFIPIAEKTGLIVPIGEWVINTVCRQNKEWQDKGYNPLRISVNLSPRQFQEENLVDVVSKNLKDVGLEPGMITLEITENLIMQNIENNLSMLTKLKELGVCISIDDFGTGYSSLNYIKDFPVDQIKIDRSFVNNICTDHKSAAIVKTVITLTHTLNLSVLAEGVETIEQYNILKALGCNALQGFLYSKPVAAEEVADMFLRESVFCFK